MPLLLPRVNARFEKRFQAVEIMATFSTPASSLPASSPRLRGYNADKRTLPLKAASRRASAYLLGGGEEEWLPEQDSNLQPFG